LAIDMASDDDSSSILPFRQRDQVPRHRSFRSDPNDLGTRLAARIRLDGAVTLGQLMRGLRSAGLDFVRDERELETLIIMPADDPRLARQS